MPANEGGNDPGQSEALDIEIQPVSRPEIAAGPDPADDGQVRLIQLGQPAEDWRVVMTYACLKQMLAHTQRNLNSEVAGLLLGRIVRTNRGLVSLAAEAVPAAYTDSGLGHVTFSHKTWEDIYQYLESLAGDSSIVGWYHTHPGFGVFFSGQDRFIQRNFFSAPGQVGTVVDPLARSLVLFGCLGEAVEPFDGLWIAAEQETYTAARRVVGALCYGQRSDRVNGSLTRWRERLRQVLGGLGLAHGCPGRADKPCTQDKETQQV